VERAEATFCLGLSLLMKINEGDFGSNSTMPGRRLHWESSDHLLLSPHAADRLKSVEIDKQLRAAEKPSNHVPIGADCF
jgi:hypothetical protein